MLDQIFIQQNQHWENGAYKNLITRKYMPDLIKSLSLKEIQVLQGIRRCGKSTIFMLLINHLIRTEDPKSILYLNLDDPFYENLDNDPKLFYQLINNAEKITGTKIKYLFLDEIQNIIGWEQFVKSVYDAQKFKKIWITGSNSSLLNSEYASLLTGRYISKMIYPLSFKEILQQNKLDNPIDLINQQSKVLRLVDSMLYHGSFPRIYQTEDASLKRELLLSYYDGIILKDCLSNQTKNIRNIRLFGELTNYLINNNACLYSYNKLAKIFGGSDSTYKEFIGVIQSSFLIKEINSFHHSLKSQIKTNKKIYTVDNGIVSALSAKLSKDHGRLLENLVFTELLKSNLDEIYYHHDISECDFITKKNNTLSAYQVCYKLTNENKTRELNGLKKAMEKWNIKHGIIITYQQEEVSDIPNIEIIPFWKWASLIT